MKNWCVSLFLFVVLFGAVFPASAQVSRSADVKSSRAFVYHGKLVRPDGSAPTGSMSVTFKILSPDPKLCVLWSEIQTVEMKDGGFSVELGHGAHRLPGASGGAAADFKQAFINNPSLTISSASCATGNSYTPTVSDDRLLAATFNDSGAVIEIAGMPIKSVPFALQAEEIGGYGLANLVKISGSGNNATLTPAEVDEMKLLANTTLPVDLKNRQVKNAADPVDPQDLVTKAYYQANLPTGTGVGSVTNVSVAGAPLSVTNGTTTPSISIAQAGTSSSGYLTSAHWNLFNDKLATTLASGQVFVGTAGNVAAGSFFGIGQMRNSTGTLQMPTSCAASQTLTWSAVTDVLACTNIAISAGAVSGLGGLATKSAIDLSTADATGNLASTRISGVLGTTSLGTGTADATKYLRGDGTWQTLPSGADNLGNHTATQNLNLGAFQLVGNGGTSGIAITNGGKVGVGSTSPNAKFEIANTVATDHHGGTPTFAIEPTNNGNTSRLRIWGDSGTAGIRIGTGADGESVNARISMYPGSVQVSNGFLQADTVQSNNGGGGGTNLVLKGTGTNDGIVFHTGGAFEKMTLRPSGFLGIGTSSPVSPFHLQVNSATGRDEFRITDTGATKAGIGLQAHYPSIDLNAYWDSPSSTHKNIGYGYSGIYGLDPTTGSHHFFGTTATGTTTAGSTVTLNNLMSILRTGSVGIGTTSPSEKLEVVGKIKGTELCIGSDCRSAWPSGGGGGTVSSVGVGGLPLSVVNSSTTPTVSIAQANTTTAGYLSAADWNTFNGKQPAGSYLTSITSANVTTALGYTPLSQTLATNQVFIGNGSNVAAAGYFGLGQLRSTATGNLQFPSACSASQTMVWSAITDVLACTSIAIGPGAISGVLGTGSLGTGTADATKYLRGDGTWQTLPSGADNLGSHTATQNLNLANYQLVGNGGSTGMSISSGGNVGIGTTSPGGALHVVAQNVVFEKNEASAYGLEFDFNRSRAGAIVQDGDSIAAMDFRGFDGTGNIRAAFISADIDGTPGTNDMPGRLVFRTTSDGSASASERLRITSAGNVGIGTSSPGRILSVNGTGGTGISLTNGTAVTGRSFAITNEDAGQLVIKDDSTGALNFIMDKVNSRMSLNGGNVGIGTTTPASPLTIGTQSGLGENLRLNSAAGATVEGGQMTLMDPVTVSSGGWEIDNIKSGSDFLLRIFRDKAAPTLTAMAINSNGNVGIGTTSPGSKLEVNGAITAANVNSIPVMSTKSSASRASLSTAGAWTYSNESVTITVPAGPTRHYRIGLRTMANSSNTNVVQVALSASSSSLTGSPTGMGLIYLHFPAGNYWQNGFTEGYVSLAPGTYTYYVMFFLNAAGTATLANATSDGTSYCNVMVWPL